MTVETLITGLAENPNSASRSGDLPTVVIRSIYPSRSIDSIWGQPCSGGGIFVFPVYIAAQILEIFVSVSALFPAFVCHVVSAQREKTDFYDAAGIIFRLGVFGFAYVKKQCQ